MHNSNRVGEKIIVAGSRSLTDKTRIYDSLDNLFGRNYIIKHDIIVSGMAIGPDKIGYDWAKTNGLKTTIFPVSKENWKKYGKRAGILRNKAMALYADRLIAFWDGISKGTKNMIEEMDKQGKTTLVFTLHENKVHLTYDDFF